MQHKAVYLLFCKFTLSLNPDKKQTEWEIIQSIVKNNNFPQHLLLKLNRQILHKVYNKKSSKNDKKKSEKHLPSIAQGSKKLPIRSKIRI